jgi:hypothetical protein
MSTTPTGGAGRKRVARTFVVWAPPDLLKRLPARPGWRLVDSTFKDACERARRSGDLSEVVDLLRQQYPLTDLDDLELADLLEAGTFTLKRRRGNPRKKDKWVALAIYWAKAWKENLYRQGWKKSKGRTSINDLAIDFATGLMEFERLPMPPDVETFKERVRREMRGRGHRKPPHLRA